LVLLRLWFILSRLGRGSGLLGLWLLLSVLLGSRGLLLGSTLANFFLLGGLLSSRSVNLLGGNTSHLLEFLGDSLFLLVGILESSGFSLLSKLLLSDLLLLHLVDGLDEHSLVLVEVTLGSKVEVMVNVLGDLLGISVFSEKSSQDSLSSHPQNLLGHSGVLGTLSLTMAGVST
jgi:hypothetical protein